MAYSDSFPATRPVFQADFANGGRVDPRITFSRSDTPPTYAAPSAVHYWSNEKHLSSENLFVQSSDFDTTWGRAGLNVPPTGGQADPSGGTDGFTWVENTQTTFHQFYQDITASGELSLTIYAKQNSGTRYLMFRFYNGSGDWTVAVFDLAGGAPLTVNSASSTRTSVSATQTASGGGYYKCNLKATGSTNSAVIALKNTYDTSGLSSSSGGASYAGDNTSSIDVAFASLTTTGATDYQSTTTQIHREYAPTLKSVGTAGQPRFEYSPTDSASEAIGSSRGLLIEGQVTNLQRYGSDFSSWSNKTFLGVESNQSIAPNGNLEADLLIADASYNPHYIYDNTVSVTAGTAHTFSMYLKDAGQRYVQICGLSSLQTSGAVNFDLQTGTASASGAHTGTITAVGNGWYRATVTTTSLFTATTGFLILAVDSISSGRVANSTGDGYKGFLAWGAQQEASSFASSLVNTGTGSSALTRAAESLSMTDASLFDNGGGALVVENKQPNATQNNAVVSITDGGSSNYVRIRGNFSNFRGEVYNNAAIQADLFGGTNDTNYHKQCITYGSNNVSFYVDGNKKGSTDTAAVIPELNTIHIGWAPVTGNGNQHIRRVVVYGNQISETEAAALTS